MLDWPCHCRGQIKRSLCGGQAGEFVHGNLAVCPLVHEVVHCLPFDRKNRELFEHQTAAGKWYI